ncbi:MAG TPA: nuclear transport factor 2 family protein [Ilumatobacteraceae bacterium]|nr:nuclear transport factor 2 family protein [Ilumatobacteraceae bacterium]
MDRETFHEYLEALDNVDVEALTTRFYHPEFSTEMGGATLDLAGLLDFEKTLKSVADPHFEPVEIVMDESGIAMDAVRTLVVLHDADVPIVGPARKGDRWEVRHNVFYTLRDGQISNIKPNVVSVRHAG